MMKPFILKRSISRKCLHVLCRKQRKNIISEIRNNLQSKKTLENCVQQSLNEVSNVTTFNTNIQCMPSPSHTKCNSFTVNLDNNIENNKLTINVEDNTFLLNNDISDDDSSSFNISSVEQSFQDRLASCFIKNNFNHVQTNSILSLLRTHSCFHNLPKDVRTLLHTPRNKVAVSKIEPGEYIHFDVETSIFRILSHFPVELLPNELELDFNTDGCYLDRSGSIHI